MKYSTWIFDFDYTLADATPGIVESMNYALTRLGFAPAEYEEIRKTVGETLENAFFALTNSNDADGARAFHELFVERADVVMTPSTELFADALDVLRKLKISGCKTAIVTSKERYRITESIEKFDMGELIDAVIGYEDVRDAKPAPEGLYAAISALGAAKSETLYVGDTVIDAETAFRAGVDFAAVTTGTTPAGAFDDYPSVAVKSSLRELPEFLEETI
ncbi:MAG: HAD family hydrolase [Oscillospiraceae bacterium]|nr:HAD family hydrolase [Oscillospiraceae bacterium]